MKFSKLAVSGGVCALIGVSILGFTFLGGFSYVNNKTVIWTLFLLLYAAPLVAILLGLDAKREIKKVEGELKGDSIANVAVLVSLVVLLVASGLVI